MRKLTLALMLAAGCSGALPSTPPGNRCHYSMTAPVETVDGSGFCSLGAPRFDRKLSLSTDNGMELIFDIAPSAHPPLLSWTAEVTTPSWHCDRWIAGSGGAVSFETETSITLTISAQCDDGNLAHAIALTFEQSK